MKEHPDILAGLSEEERRKILALGSPLRLPSNAELFPLGAHAASLYIVERGRIKLTLPMHIRGNPQDILVEEINAGQTVGWSALIPPHRFTLKATVLVDAELISIRADALRAYFAENPSVGCAVCLNLAELIGHRLLLSQAMWLREMQRAVELQYA